MEEVEQLSHARRSGLRQVPARELTERPSVAGPERRRGLVHRGSTRASPLVILGLALLWLLACETQSPPLAPQESSRPVLQSGLSFLTDGVLTFLLPPNLHKPRHAEKLIRASEGGSVELSGFRVYIPPDALRRDTVITIDLPTTLPEALYVVADFGPDGLTFAKPVKLTFPLGGVSLVDIDLVEVKIWYWNGTKWKEPAGRATSKSVTRRTTHFSTYGARGIDTPSGG